MAVYINNEKIRQIVYQPGMNDKSINISEVWFADGIYEPMLIFQYDIDPPTLSVTTPTGTSDSSPTYTTSSSYIISGTVSDSDSGVKAVYVNGEEATITGTAWSYTMSLSADKATTINVYAIDNANNVTETIVRYVMYDSAAPTLSVTAPTGSSSSSPTYQTSSSLTVSGTASDTGSGIDYVTVNGATASGTTSWSYSLTLSANTTTTITVIAYDKAGRSTTVTRYAMYDSAAPTLSVTAPTSTSSSSPTYTTSSSYTVSGTASDTGSGIKSVTVNGNTCSGTTSWSYSLSLTANSTTTITIIATDNADRTTTATRYVMYDSAAPTLSITAPTATSSSSPTSTMSSSYTVSGTATDSGSGIATVTVNGTSVSVSSSGSFSRSITLTQDSTTTVTIVATDNAGRSTTATRYVRYEAGLGTMTGAWQGYWFNGNSSVAGLSQVRSDTATVYDVIEQTGWHDSLNDTIIAFSASYKPQSITFTTPAIVNTQQNTSVGYTIYGSNSSFDGSLSSAQSMSWTTLSSGTWTQTFQGGETKTLSCKTSTSYKYIWIRSDWFYGANDYHGVRYLDFSVNVLS